MEPPTPPTVTVLTLRRTLFPSHRSDTLHFQNPHDTVSYTDVTYTTTSLPLSCKMKYRIRKAARRPCLYRALNDAGMVESVKTKDVKINLFWGNRMDDADFLKLNAFQRVNHFPGTYYLGRKDHLLRGLARMRRAHGKTAFDFFPTTFFLPKDASMIRSEMVRDPSVVYIAKPPASSCGKGIYVFNTESDIPPDEEEYIVQHYVPNPYLISGHKFDMRIYVAVTCYDPLKIYVYKEGIVRFATVPYSLDPTTLGNRLMHLTNYSIQHHAEGFQKSRDEAEGGKAHKWSLSQLRSHMQTEGLDYDKMWASVQDLIIKTLLTCEATVVSKVKGYKETCFELYGFDVLLTSAMAPIIMEVNVWPSLNCGSPLDKRIKGIMIAHLLNLIGIQPSAWDNDITNVIYNNPRVAPVRHGSLEALEATSASPYQWLSTLQEPDKIMLRGLIDEDCRKGEYVRVFPCHDGEGRYCPFFDSPRYASITLCRWCSLMNGSHAHPEMPAALLSWLQGSGDLPLAMVRDAYPAVPRASMVSTLRRRASMVVSVTVGEKEQLRRRRTISK